MPLRMFSPTDIVPSGRRSRSPLRIDIGRQRIDHFRGIDLIMYMSQLRNDLYIIIEFYFITDFYLRLRSIAIFSIVL